MKAFIIMFLSLLTLSACNAKSEISEQNDHVIGVKNSTIQKVDQKTGQEVSKHLVSLATSIPNVNDATAVVVGKYAIVGIDVDKNLDRSEVGSIKYSVAESLKNDPHGARAVVIADPDTNARLKEIYADIQNGKPLQGIMNELADISGRLMPEIPADMIEPSPANNSTEKPKQNLNGPEKQNLEKQQQEQSNHYK